MKTHNHYWNVGGVCGLVAAAVCAASSSQAELYLMDSFPSSGSATVDGHYRSANIRTQAPAILGETGQWLASTTDTGVFSVDAVSSSLDYSATPSSLSAPSGSARMRMTHNDSTGNMRTLWRELDGVPMETDLYFSALMMYSGTTFSGYTDNQWTGVGLIANESSGILSGTALFPDGFVFAFQKLNINGIARARLVAHLPAASALPIILHDDPQPNTAYLVVAKIEYDANGAETFRFAVNPAPSQEVFPHSLSADLLSGMRGFTHVKVGCCWGLGGGSVYVDELRVGASYEDVVGAPLATSSFVGAAVAGVTPGGDIGVTFEMASRKAGAPVRLLMGVEPGVWTITNDIASVSPLTPVTVLPQGDAPDTTYYYTVMADDGADGEVFSGATPPTFLSGEVSFSVATAAADEETLAPAIISVRRAITATNAPLDVRYAVLDGTAIAGADYIGNTHIGGTLTIPAGADSADIVIQPIRNFSVLVDTALSVELLPGAYHIGAPSLCDVTIVNQTPPAGYSVWLGNGGANDSATDGNWFPPRVPGETDHVLLGDYSQQSMAISAEMTVASWTQEQGYTGTVSINAPFSADAPLLTILGDCALIGGKWTHQQGRSAQSHKLFAEVRGDMLVGAAAQIDCYAKGYGAGILGSGATQFRGSAHGGENAQEDGKTYGSAFRPLLYGSYSNTDGSTAGGVVQLNVLQTLTLDGLITTRGNSYGSGGSILLSLGRLVGDGEINADGNGNNSGFANGGGRIAIYLAAAGAAPSDFAGGVHANGGGGQLQVSNPQPQAGNGTIYWQTAADADCAGTLLIYQDFVLSHGANFERRACVLPPELECDDNYRNVTIALQENGRLKLRAPIFANHLEIITAVKNKDCAPKLNLNNQTLTVRSLSIGGQQYKSGSYTAADFALDGFGAHVADAPEALGAIIVQSQGTMLILR